jgi:hypothetical protein
VKYRWKGGPPDCEAEQWFPGKTMLQGVPVEEFPGYGILRGVGPIAWRLRPGDYVVTARRDPNGKMVETLYAAHKEEFEQTYEEAER